MRYLTMDGFPCHAGEAQPLSDGGGAHKAFIDSRAVCIEAKNMVFFQSSPKLSCFFIFVVDRQLSQALNNTLWERCLDIEMCRSIMMS